MKSLTNYITEIVRGETITTWYVHVDDAYQRICLKLSCPMRQRGPEPVLSDSELITIALIIETYYQGHEEVGYAFVGQYLNGLFRHLIDLDRFNSRRRALVWFIEAIRRDLRNQIIDQSDRVRIVDSAPSP